MQYEVATAGRLALEPELGAVPRASRDLHLERLAAHPDAGRAAAEGVEQADVEVRLGTGGSSRRALGAEPLPRTPNSVVKPPLVKPPPVKPPKRLWKKSEKSPNSSGDTVRNPPAPGWNGGTLPVLPYWSYSLRFSSSERTV